MVPMSESLFYYCTVFLIALIFLTDASSAINESLLEISSSTQRSKYAPIRDREANFVKNQNQDTITDVTGVNKRKSNKSNESQSLVNNYGFGNEREFLSLSGSGRVDDIKDNENGTDGGNASDDEKTLSQQVADGKYGLIQNEIFTARPSRLGVLSYDANPEVPKDNINNLGGLVPDDVWLAENHLLVVAGNSFNGLQNDWRPIDDYTAPSRPVQIPPNPKVPPPFPVQLTDNGPVEYVKSSDVQLVRPFKPFYSFNPMLSLYNKSQSIYGKIPYGFNVTPPKNRFTPPNIPFPPPTYVKPPPGAEFIPSYLTSTNVSSPEIDDEDSSLHYPPPYDFYYPKDNTTKVPPGPLVPGIILPPPVNFFSPFINDSQEPSYLKPGKLKSGKQLNFAPGNPPSLTTFIPYDDDVVNDISYPSLNDVKLSFKTDNNDEEWIPIPAPKPFYITGEKKPSQSAILTNLKEPTNLLKMSPHKPTFKYLQHVEPLVNELFYTTTTSNPRLIDSTLSPTRNNVHSTSFVEPNIKATYYFYEEPQSTDATPLAIPISTTTRPLTRPVDVDNTNNILYGIPPSKGPLAESRRKPIPVIPIYYLAELENSMETAKPTDVSYLDIRRPGSSTRPEFFTSTDSPAYSPPNPVDNRTPKPLFEYDYVASNYNRKPIGDATGGAPFIDYNSYQPSFQNYHRLPEFNMMFRFPKPEIYQSTSGAAAAGPVSLLHYPSYNSFEHSWLPMFSYYHQFPHPTENPYYDYFTKEEGDLVDDKTKTYFDIFGRKLRQNVESTTPLSAQSSINPTFLRPEWKQNYRQRPSQSLITSSSSSYVSHSEESSETNTKPPSLEGDTFVNYVTPNPTQESDAEYVTPNAKYVRPIVVEDLPADFHERLNNVMSTVRKSRKNPSSPRNRFRYTLVDHKLDYSPSRVKINNHLVDDVEHVDVPEPISLHRDVNVNYQHSPQITVDSQAEYINVRTPPKSRQRPRVIQNLRPSIESDIPIGSERRPNYSNIDSRKSNDGKESSNGQNVISYKYPEVERGRFYFLFPAGTSLNHIENEQRDFQSDAEKPGSNFKRKLREKASK